MLQTDLFSWQDPSDFIDFGLIGEVIALTPAPTPIIPPKPASSVVLKPGSSIADVQAAWESLPAELQYTRIKLTFVSPVCMRVTRRKLSEPKTVHTYRLFVGKGNVLAYTNRRSGYAFESHHAAKLIRIEEITKTTDPVEMVRKLANRIHPNAWGDLKAKLMANPQEYHNNYGYTVTSISSKFPGYVLEDIKAAFEQKTRYNYDTGGSYFAKHKKGRDLKVECQLCDDGIYRAWFSSEFPGCANGDYWLLINPTTAIFKERD